MTDRIRSSICGPDGMHPAHCLGKGACIHCGRKRFKGHVPSRCALCNWDKKQPKRAKQR